MRRHDNSRITNEVSDLVVLIIKINTEIKYHISNLNILKHVSMDKNPQYVK